MTLQLRFVAVIAVALVVAYFVIATRDQLLRSSNNLIGSFPIRQERAAIDELWLNDQQVVRDGKLQSGRPKFGMQSPLVVKGKLVSRGWDLVADPQRSPDPKEIRVECQIVAIGMWGAVSETPPQGLDYTVSPDDSAWTLDGPVWRLESAPAGRYALQILVYDQLNDLDPGPNMRFDWHVIGRYEFDVE